MRPMERDLGGARRQAGPAVLASAATGIVGYIEKYSGDVNSIFGNSGLAPEMAGAATLKLRLNDFCTLFEEFRRPYRLRQFRPVVRQPVPAA